MNRSRYVVALTLVGACGRGAPASGASQAGHAVVECPASITVEQRFTGGAGPWNVGSDTGAPQLAGVTFYDGPPAEMASLVNDTAAETQDTWTGVWRFSQDAGKGYWVACAYTQTNVGLSTRLPPGTSECHVTYAKSVSWPEGGRVVKEMGCEGGH